MDVAEAPAQTLLSSPEAIPNRLFKSQLVAMLPVKRRDAAAADEQYAALNRRQRTIMRFVMLAIDRILGILSQTMGSIGQAAAHFVGALAFRRKAGYRPELAWTCYDNADMLLAYNSEETGPRPWLHNIPAGDTEGVAITRGY